MSLQDSWVDKIFSKLSITYGRDFLARWEGLDLADVKADWSEELAGLSAHPDRIRFALENLPAKPPTVLEFRMLAFTMPIVAMPALHAPDPVGLKRVADSMAAGQSVSETPSEWMARLWDEVLAGTASSARVRHYRIAESNGYYGNLLQADGGDFTPIPAESLPPGMR